jgi:xylan 1,4-beta-xylosidase
MYIRNSLLTVVLLLWTFASISAQVIRDGGNRPADSQPGKPLRYINPLVIENAGRLADPTVIKFHGKYYLYLTGGLSSGGRSETAVWSSEDLVNWEYHEVSLPEGIGIEAPTAVVYKEYVYITGNDKGLFRSTNPLGPFEFFGDFLDENGQRLERERDPGRGWDDGGVFDPAIFVDEDNRVYLYYAGGATAGVYGVELDSRDLRKFLGPPFHFFRFETAHIWERYGNWNEYGGFSWIEGPWMTKRNDTYYLQYAAPGTDWKTYGVGVYTSKNPLGPFTYYEESPVLIHKNGLIGGSGHHSIVEGPDGTIWAIYTLLYRNWNRMFERRIGMDPVGFDEDGNMVINGPSEIPQWAPGVRTEPWKENNSGSIPLTEDKNYTVSSEAPGRDAPYAVDSNSRTWWSPAEDDREPWVIFDLGSASEQHYIIDSARLLFTLPVRLKNEGSPARVRKYKIEVSPDGESFETVVNKTRNNRDNAVEFDEIEPVQGRYVKLTITGWPDEVPVGVIEFTVFGKPGPIYSRR